MHITLCCLPAVLAVAAAPFGLPPMAFWIYVYALLLLFVGLGRNLPELPHKHGLDKLDLFARLFYAIPLGVFGTEHFTNTAGIALGVPRWIPAHTFWVYAVGLGFLCAALSFTVLVQARLAAALTAMTLLTFVLTIDIPAVVARPHNRFFWALALRELAFSGGALALALSRWSTPAKQPWRAPSRAAALPRFFLGVAALFYGVQELLHPDYVPGIPLNKLTPEWIHGRIVLSYFVGLVLIAAGACLLVNKKARIAATGLGLTILLAVLWVYLPMLVAAPRDVVALNFFFDTLMFGGAVLLVAGALDAEPS